MLLEVNGVTVAYGKHIALHEASLSVELGEMVAILGANGAGKSSLLNAIAARTPATAGSIEFDGRDIGALPPHLLVEAGVALVPEGRGIFPRMSVAENLALGALPLRAQGRIAELEADVYALFPKLAERSAQIVGTMSGGEQQMVAIARALMSAPTLLLLDEPSLGLAPIVAQEVFAALARVREQGLTVVLVEQNARASLAIADRAYLVEAGRITGSGSAAELRDDPSVVQAFLGGAPS